MTGLARHDHPATAKEAAAGVDNIAAKRRRVLEAIAGGYTDEEVSDITGMPGNTVRPRRVELIGMGLVARTERTRPTRSGRRAIVWDVTDKGLAALMEGGRQ
jgi:predicted ArsR family transcriptional regulator